MDEDNPDDTIISIDENPKPPTPHRGVKLYPPGKIMHLLQYGKIGRADRRYVAVWKGNDCFNDIIVHKRMMSDHMPDDLKKALQSAIL